MRTSSTPLILAAFAWALLNPAPDVHAHATYNLSGYGSGLGGSTNGADGAPANASSLWTNGPVEYTGTLPVNWYSGIHSPTQVRTIQTGLSANPPSGSLLAQVTSYNTANDPDLLADAVIAVGGLSWSDPANGNQGWGHGLDYGILHLTPLDEIEADGPVRLTITLTDDPSDGVAVQLAYALYGGWDTSTTAVRHQTFTTSPSPVDDPLGSSGLKLIDFVAASAAGATLSRSYDVDNTYEGKYTIFVGALGGVAGQYQLTAGVYPTGTELNEQLAQCQANLADMQATVDAMTSDTDADTVPDQRDACANTAAGQFVDQIGCSQAQFCASFPVATKADRKACKKADWKNDEPLLTNKQADCAFVKSSKTCDATP
jgi:hypothetical protein